MRKFKKYIFQIMKWYENCQKLASHTKSDFYLEILVTQHEGSKKNVRKDPKFEKCS